MEVEFLSLVIGMPERKYRLSFVEKMVYYSLTSSFKTITEGYIHEECRKSLFTIK